MRLAFVRKTAGMAAVGTAIATLLGAPAAVAGNVGIVHPMCVYVSDNGAKGEISALKCTNPDGVTTSNAVWDDESTLMTVHGDQVLTYVGSDVNGQDRWVLWFGEAALADARKELMRSYGYTGVYMLSDPIAYPDAVFVSATYDVPSKKKN